MGRSCAAIPAAALVATCHLFALVALTDGNSGNLDAYVGHHGVCLNVLQEQGQLYERNRHLEVDRIDFVIFLYFGMSGVSSYVIRQL